MEKLKISILNHIRKGDAQKAFDILNKVIEPFNEVGIAVATLQARFNFLGLDKIKNTINFDGYVLEMNKINDSLINLCRLIEKEHLVAMDENVPSKHIAYYLIQRAEKFRQNKDLEKAILDLIEAVRQQPKNIAIQNDLAMCYRMSGKYSEALNIFDNIKDKRPHDVLCLNELATCQRELERYSAALETLNRGLTLQPDNNHFHSNKFFIHLFFTLNKNEAIAIRDYYEQTFGKKLMLKSELQDLYNRFLEHFEAIHNLLIEEDLVRRYIEECQKKRAFNTAKSLLIKLERSK